MQYLLWVCFAVPAIAAGMILHFKLKEWGKKPWNIVPKCLSTWIVVGTAAIGVWFNGDSGGLHRTWILGALILFMIADGLLEVKFFIGMGAFAAGHMILIVWILQKGYFSPISILIWFILSAAVLLLFKKEMMQFKKKPIFYLTLLYPAVLAAVVSVAAVLPHALGKSYGWIAVGLALFAISDMFVGKNFFQPLSKSANYLALSLYYAGIFCIAMMTWQ